MPQLFHWSFLNLTLKSGLRTWVKDNIPKDGDDIFKGKVLNEGSNDDIEDFDWLEEELVA